MLYHVKLNIDPNPGDNIIHFEGIPTRSYIIILDQNMRKVVSLTSIESNFEINTEHIVNGLYYLVCQNAKLGMQKTSKLSIIH